VVANWSLPAALATLAGGLLFGVAAFTVLTRPRHLRP